VIAFDMRLTIDRQDPLRYEKDILKVSDERCDAGAQG